LQTENNTLLQRHPNPFTKSIVVWDTSEVYSDQEDNLNALSSIGFEPYFVSNEMDTRPEVQAKAKISGMVAFRQKIWMKRPREISNETLNLEQI